MLYYETIEKDSKLDWVVFIHGIGGSTKTWKKQIDDFSQNHNILLLDLAGHGNSRDEKSDHNLLNIPQEIKKVLDFLNIEKAHFVGMSLGTLILLFYALIYPDTVKSLILGGAVTKLTISGKVTIWIAQKTKKLLPHKAISKIFALALMPKKNHEKSRKIFIRESLKMKKEELVLWMNALDMVKYAETYVDILKNLKNIPILYVMGSEDHFFLKGTSEVANEINAKLKIIKDCGHVCTIERYKEFNRIALDFIKDNTLIPIAA